MRTYVARVIAVCVLLGLTFGVFTAGRVVERYKREPVKHTMAVHEIEDVTPTIKRFRTASGYVYLFYAEVTYVRLGGERETYLHLVQAVRE